MCGHKSAYTNVQSDGAGSYHVRVGLQHKASLFPPLLSVVVLKHITQTLKTQITGEKWGNRLMGYKGFKEFNLNPVLGDETKLLSGLTF